MLQNKIEDSVSNEEVEVDIDELLDMDSDEHRRRHLQNILINAKGSQNDVKVMGIFILLRLLFSFSFNDNRELL
ncbi:unnamed protein product [Ceutorhynchus assimilis]|uniref:Uncharacterized protein n=1 Tax=Ceutorhynchus assimilis TaxID=467358 RepID=A0A9N9QMV2_9CUCU|nr:unnamed protein product [Ceutorhynchus assimilis]